MGFVQHRSLIIFALLCAWLCAAACLDKASKDNDAASFATGGAPATMSSDGAQRAASGSGAKSPGAAGNAGVTGASGSTAPATPGTTRTNTPPAAGNGAPTKTNTDADDDAGVTAPPTAEGAAGSGPTGGEAGAPATTEPMGTTAPDPSLVAGTGTSCASYATPADGKCGTYYCGVDLPTLTMAIDPTTVCGKDPDFTCNGNLIIAVGTCARQVKSENLLDSNDALRPKVEACVYEDAVIKEKVAPECLSCFITAATCAGDNCLTQCLAGDSPGCDACRKQANCEAPVFACGGLPSPF